MTKLRIVIANTPLDATFKAVAILAQINVMIHEQMTTNITYNIALSNNDTKEAKLLMQS